MNYVKCSKNGNKVPGKCRDGREWPGSRKSYAEEEKKVIYSDKVKSLSHVRLLVTPLTAAHQAPPSMGFSRQENPHWSGVPLPSPYTMTGIWWMFNESGYITIIFVIMTVDRKTIINKGKTGVLQRTVQCDSSKGRKEDIWRGVLGNSLKVIEREGGVKMAEE